ncbi:metal-sensitive transcriptional regulator [Kytococcus sp. Marseille-QA3725]
MSDKTTGGRPGADHDHGYIDDKEAYLNRMRRIEGQARGIARMIEEDAYCIDILTQVSAVNRALEKVAIGLLEDHLHTCVVDAARSDEEDVQEIIAEASAAITRLVRS